MSRRLEGEPNILEKEYVICKTCHGDHLRAIVDETGICKWCRATECPHGAKVSPAICKKFHGETGE